MNPTLRPEVKSKWLDALRSGNYTQTTAVLRDDKGYCCLGVLCEVAVAEGVIPPAVNGGELFHDQWVYGPGGDRMTAALPVTVQEWAFEAANGNADPMLGDMLQASEWNDQEGASFDEIADLIEKYL